jgi:hypothetical protein
MPISKIVASTGAVYTLLGRAVFEWVLERYEQISPQEGDLYEFGQALEGSHFQDGR